MADTKKSKIKYYTVAIAIVIIVAAILIVPRWNRYQTQRRSTAAREAVAALRNYVDDYVKNHQSAGGFNVDAALTEIGISNRILRNWDFAIAWKPSAIYTQQMMESLREVETSSYVNIAPYKIIMAVATKEGPVTEGRKIWYDGDNNSFHGFGIDSEVEPDWGRILPNP